MTEIIIPWVALSFVVAFLGTDRKIGGGYAFLSALLLSPVVGFIIIAFSPSKSTLEYQQKHIERLDQLIEEIQRDKDQGGAQEQQLKNSAEFDATKIDTPKLTLWQKIKYGL